MSAGSRSVDTLGWPLDKDSNSNKATPPKVDTPSDGDQAVIDGDRIPTLSRQKHPNLATCFGLQAALCSAIPRHLGTEIIQITCSKHDIWQGDTKRAAHSWKLPSSLPVHKELLCRYSRYFNNRFGNPFENAIVSEVLQDILFDKEKHFPTIKPCCLTGTPHPCSSSCTLKSDYIPSCEAVLGEWSQGSQGEGDLEVVQQQEQQGQILLDESPIIFASLIHWLYTQKLAAIAQGGMTDEQVYTHLYAMAERLDFPTLRRDCYQKLTNDYYYDKKNIPGVTVAKIIIEECSPSSLLRKYLIAMLVYVMDDKNSKEEKKAAKAILDLDKGFAATVTEDFMTRLWSKEGCIYPCDLHEYEKDDSDSDVGSSIDIGSDMAYDSEGYISLSGSEDDESLAKDDLRKDDEDNIVGEPASEEEQIVATKLNHAETSATQQSATVIPDHDSDGIKSEAATSLDIPVAKSQRESSESEDPSKRPQGLTKAEFMDLTNS